MLRYQRNRVLLEGNDDISSDENYLEGRTAFVKELEGFHPRNRIDKRLLIGVLKRKHVDPSDTESEEDKRAMQKIVRQLTKRRFNSRFR